MDKHAQEDKKDDSMTIPNNTASTDSDSDMDSHRLPLLSSFSLSSSCLKPQTTPVPGIHGIQMSRIINVGFPKCGSSSIHALFKKSGFHSSHWSCGGGRTRRTTIYCGKCIHDQLKLKSNTTTSLPYLHNWIIFTKECASSPRFNT